MPSRPAANLRSRPARALAVCAAAVAALAAVLVPVSPPAASGSAFPDGVVRLEGHGWGHGRGMGQWGSLGYAVRHGWDYRRILDHYYGGTTLGTGVPNHDMRVWLSSADGHDLIVSAGRPFTVGDRQFSAGTFVRVRRTGTNTFALDTGGGCGGPWGPVADRQGVTGPVEASTGAPVTTDDLTQLLQRCVLGGEPGTRRWYRGTLRAVEHQGLKIVNNVPLQQYLWGVVPRESPASWGNAGGGSGMHSLRAQAVAARSYSVADRAMNSGAGKYPPYADTCDTIFCQVYGGAALNGTLIDGGQAANTRRAVDETAGEVRRNASGAVARTEFSSSTGGFTAGGTFPSVRDEGDDICISGGPCNPNHRWSTEVPVRTVEERFPAIGRLQRIEVTRNGLGSMGGRVLQVEVRGTNGTVTRTGLQFRSDLGLRSDWFQVLGMPSGGVSGYWLSGPDGGVFTFGDAPFLGSMGGTRLAQPVVGMAARPQGDGYWLVASDGGIFSFGQARFHGSTGAMRLNQPVVGMAPTPTGRGYWLVASDGGIFSFGDARFFGSTGAMRLAQPVVGMTARPQGDGYWLVARDGGLFTFGRAGFGGSLGAVNLGSPVVGMAATYSGHGYWIVVADGRVRAFGDAPDFGDAARLGARVSGLAPRAQR